MTGQILLDPLIPLPLIYALGALAALGLALAVWRRLAGWALRALAALVLLAAIANPSLQTEDRAALSDIVIAVVDRSASQRIADRPAQTQAALEKLRAEVAGRANTELRVVDLGDGEGDRGTQLMTALSEALSEEPRGRVAGMVLITDGRAHDMASAPLDLPAPLHALLTGQEDDWDRRLVVKNAPSFAILGEPVTLTLRIEDQGAAPEAGQVDLTIAVDGGDPMDFEVPVNEDIELPVDIPHGGMNVLQFATPEAEGELTDRNNASVVQINGVRDRLSVLLVSGEPHAGERTWRNLLKSDSAVDLVHFTILRPPKSRTACRSTSCRSSPFPRASCSWKRSTTST